MALSPQARRSYQWQGALSAAGYNNAPPWSTRAPGVIFRGNDLTVSHDVHHWDGVGQQVIRYDSAVAAPPHGFGAHDGATLGREPVPPVPLVPAGTPRSRHSRHNFERMCSAKAYWGKPVAVLRRWRRPPSEERWTDSPIPTAASAAGKTSMLNCGFVRERGIERTSTNNSIRASRSKAMNSANVRVEWPIVKIVRAHPRERLVKSSIRQDPGLNVRRRAAGATYKCVSPSFSAPILCASPRARFCRS